MHPVGYFGCPGCLTCCYLTASYIVERNSRFAASQWSVKPTRFAAVFKKSCLTRNSTVRFWRNERKISKTLLSLCMRINTNSKIPGKTDESLTSIEDDGNFIVEEEDQLQEERVDTDVEQLEDFDDSEISLSDDAWLSKQYLVSEQLEEYLKKKQEGALEVPQFPIDKSTVLDWWVCGVEPKKFRELQNLYGMWDFVENPQCDSKLQSREKAIFKARKLYASVGVPAIADSILFVIDSAGSHSQGYSFEQLDDSVDNLLENLRTISKPTRLTKFFVYVAYYDGEREFVEESTCEVDIFFAHTSHATIATSTAFDNLMVRLRSALHLPAYRPHYKEERDVEVFREDRESSTVENRWEKMPLLGANLLAEKVAREGKVLQDGLIKVTSFLNHQVDVSLMEACGKDLASLLFHTYPTKVLTIETSGLLPSIGVAKELNVPLVYARQGKSMTMSECYHTFYRSQTKGELYELVVSTEYIGKHDRIVIIDDFLAGGSTIDALIRLAKMAQAHVCGIGVLIERTDMRGKAFLSGYNIPIVSLVKLSVSSEGIIIEDFENPQN
eukprot:jgi/Galph1/3473/GphlegSOOS_G2151.1